MDRPVNGDCGDDGGSDRDERLSKNYSDLWAEVTTYPR
jgi:hypothetical protein